MKSYAYSLADMCTTVWGSHGYSRITRAILSEFDLLTGHPWGRTAQADSTTYYALLSGLVSSVAPTRVLEIGTGFGLSAATILSAMPTVDLFVTIDLGNFSEEYSFSENNIEFAKGRIHAWCDRVGVPKSRVNFFKANTQPVGTDNSDKQSDSPNWRDVQDLQAEIDGVQFDMIFIDGKHTGYGLLNDLVSFWPLLAPGGVVVCDDMHDESYRSSFEWAGDTLACFRKFLLSGGYESFYIWDAPHVLPAGRDGTRPMGIIRKAGRVPCPLTIVSSPMDMTTRGRIQENAVHSWQASIPGADILLLSDSPGVAELAERMGVRHYHNIESDSYGVPLVRSLFSIAGRLALSDTVMYINSDIILTPSMSDGILSCRSEFGNFFGIGQRWDVDFPACFRFMETPGWFTRLSAAARFRGRRHAKTGMDYFVFDRRFWDSVEIPEFSLGRMAWDGWLAVTASRRPDCPTVDMTDAVTIVHQNHPRGSGINYSTSVLENRKLGGRDAEVGTDVAGKRLSSSKFMPKTPLDVYTQIYDSNYVAPLYALCGIPNSEIRDESPQSGRYDELSIEGRKYLRLVDSIEDSQVVIFSTPWESVESGRAPLGMERFVELSKQAESVGKRVVVLYNSDDAGQLGQIPAGVPLPIVFRTSLDSKTRGINEWALPAWSSDILPQTVALDRESSGIPTVSFCGLTTSTREKMLQVLESADGIDTRFVRRADFWGHLSIPDRHIWRDEYVGNMLSGDYALCVRGAGNFSYRLYEAMCCGRVPVLLDTDVVLPFEEYIPWDSLIIRVGINDIGGLPDRLVDFHKYMRYEDWRRLRADIRSYWEDWLSPLGFCRALNLVYSSMVGGGAENEY